MRKLPIILLAGTTIAFAACADGDNELYDEDTDVAVPGEEITDDVMDEDAAETAEDARELVSDAAATVQEMRTDTDLAGLLETAQGVLIIPNYGRAAAGVGIRGGEGVLMVKQNGSWTGPAFYDIGGVSLGVQLGGEGGEIALLLMNQEAVEHFRQENNFSLNADAGLTVIDYSAQALGTASDSDVVMWSDTEGAFAGVSLSVTDVMWDEEQNAVLNGRTVTPQEALGGSTMNSSGAELQQALSGR